MTKNFNEILQKTITEGLSETGESVTQWSRFQVVSSYEAYMTFPGTLLEEKKNQDNNGAS